MKGHLNRSPSALPPPPGLLKRHTDRRFMVMVLVVAISPEAVLLVVMSIARHALIGMDGCEVGFHSIALLLGRRRQRGVGTA